MDTALIGACRLACCTPQQQHQMLYQTLDYVQLTLPSTGRDPRVPEIRVVEDPGTLHQFVTAISTSCGVPTVALAIDGALLATTAAWYGDEWHALGLSPNTSLTPYCTCFQARSRWTRHSRRADVACCSIICIHSRHSSVLGAHYIARCAVRHGTAHALVAVAHAMQLQWTHTVLWCCVAHQTAYRLVTLALSTAQRLEVVLLCRGGTPSIKVATDKVRVRFLVLALLVVSCIWPRLDQIRDTVRTFARKLGSLVPQPAVPCTSVFSINQRLLG